jgi:DNA mismatch repair protein MutS
VGRLAGLPRDVVQRAWEILALLESGHHVAGIAPPPAPDAQQLALFAAGEHPVVKELRDLDPETLTPIEALTRLAELKKRAEDR